MTTQWTIQKTVGHNIKNARENRVPKMSQGDLGKALAPYLDREDGWSKQEVSDAENGKKPLPLDDLLAFARALNLSMDELMAPNPGGHGGYELENGELVRVNRFGAGAEHGPVLRAIERRMADQLSYLEEVKYFVAEIEKEQAEIYNLIHELRSN